MKLNKITLIAALALGSLLTLGTVNAQDASTNTPAATPPAAGPGRTRLTPDQILAKLDLSDDVKAKAKAILDDQRKQTADARKDDSLSTEDKRAKMKTIREDATTKLKAILTDEQFAKYQKLAPGRRPATPPPTN